VIKIGNIEKIIVGMYVLGRFIAGEGKERSSAEDIFRNTPGGISFSAKYFPQTETAGQKTPSLEIISKGGRILIDEVGNDLRVVRCNLPDGYQGKKADFLREVYEVATEAYLKKYEAEYGHLEENIRNMKMSDLNQLN